MLPARRKTTTPPFTYNRILDGKTIKNFEIVIARYDENINWCSNYKDYVTVYNKGNDDISFNTIKLENRGHLADTILRHIITNYDNLADVTFFTHGSWNYRSDQLIRDINDMYNIRFKKFQDFIKVDPNSLIYIQRWDSPKPDDRQLHMSYSMSNVYKYFFEKEYPKHRYPWCCGKIMSVGRNRIRKTPLHVYERMLEFCNRKFEGGDEQLDYRTLGIYIERLILLCFI
jgi:hypothetical protein